MRFNYEYYYDSKTILTTFHVCLHKHKHLDNDNDMSDVGAVRYSAFDASSTNVTGNPSE